MDDIQEKNNQDSTIFGKAIGQLIHDIRNSLNTIIGFSSILQIDESINEEAKGYLKKIFQSGISIEQLLSNIDYFLMDKIELKKEEIEIKTTFENYINTQLDIINDKQIKIEYLSDANFKIKFSLDLFNKMLDCLFQFSQKGMRNTEEKYIQIYFKKNNDSIFIFYSDASSPVFINKNYFDFDEIMKCRRGLGVMFLKKYVELYNGKIEYKYGQKWQEFVSVYTQQIRNNHGFIIELPQ